MEKRILSLMLALMLAVSIVTEAPIPAKASWCSSFSGWNQSYDLSNKSPGEKLAAVAVAQDGKIQSQMGYSAPWCAYFIMDCAELAGVSSAVPHASNGVTTTLRDAILANGGYQVGYGDAQPGDIVTIRWDGSKGVDHVEIVYKVSGGVVYTVGGNYISGSKHMVKVRSKSSSSWLKSRILGVYRPNYSSTPSVPVGKTSQPSVSVDGQNVTVSWTYDGNGTSVAVYLIQEPWGWEDIKHTQVVSPTTTSCTFSGVAPGYYQAFTIAQPNEAHVQSQWTEFTVPEPHTTHEKGEFRYSASDHPHYNYYACSVCGEEFTDGSTTVNSSCSQCHPEHSKGEFKYATADHPHYNYYVCSVCGEEFTDRSTTVDYSCVQCHPSHIWDAGTIAVPPTVDVVGLMLYTCTACGETRTEIIPATGSTPTPEPDPIPEPDPSPATFIDVSATAYYADAVSWAVNQGITSGIGSGRFGPNISCTRGQMVVFLWKSQGQPEPGSTENPFVDVKESDYYYKAVLWAAQMNISAGTDETHFSPNLKCTRAQAVTFLWRVEDCPEAETRRSFSDVSPKSYYAKAVDWAVEYGVTSGVGNGQFGPSKTCSRGQIVTFLYQAMKE